MIATSPATGVLRPWRVLSVLCLGFFVILLDTTIVNIALPALTTGLSATLDQLLWTVNAYPLTYAGLLLAGGRLGDRYGPRRLFLIGLTVFTAASALCGLAWTPWLLIGARAVQGVGGALLTPQTLAMITAAFPVERRGSAYGVWGGVAGLATLAGPVLGGWLVTGFGWRWIFFVNVPIGVVTLVLAVRVLPAVTGAGAHRLGLRRSAVASVAMLLVCLALIEGPAHRFGPVVIALLVAGVAMLAMLVRGANPLADRNFALMCGVLAAISFGTLGLLVPLVILLQSVLSLSALQAGLVLAPMALASVAGAPLAGRLADRFGGKDTLVAGLVLWAGGIALVGGASRLPYDRFGLVSGLVVAGFGLGMTFAPVQSIAMRDVAPRVAATAAGVINTARQLGAVLGAAVTGALLQARLSVTLGPAARADVQALPLSFRSWVLDGFDRAAASIRGLEVGAGQTGAHLPADLPASVRPAVEQVALATFHDAFVPAMRTTLVVPVAVLAIAVLGTFFVRRGAHSSAERTNSVD